MSDETYIGHNEKHFDDQEFIKLCVEFGLYIKSLPDMPLLDQQFEFMKYINAIRSFT